MTFLKMIGWLSPIINAAKSEDKTQAIMDLLNDLMENDLDETLESFESFTEDDKGVCLSLFFATMGNMDAIKYSDSHI